MNKNFIPGLTRDLIILITLLAIMAPLSHFMGEGVGVRAPAFPIAQAQSPTKAEDIFTKIKGINSEPASGIKNLPVSPATKQGQPASSSWTLVLAALVKILLNIAGALALLGFTLAGTLMVVGTQGKPDLLDKGKQLMKSSIFGLIIIAISYALVLGISELQFFTPGASGGEGTTTSGGAAAGGGTQTQAPASQSGNSGGKTQGG